MSSERKTTALSGTTHSSRISESLRVARMPSVSQLASTVRPAVTRGTSSRIPAVALVAPSG